MAALADNYADSMEGLDITAEDLEALAAEGALDDYLSDDGGEEDFDFAAREQAMAEVEQDIADFSNVIFVNKLPKAPVAKKKKLCAVRLAALSFDTSSAPPARPSLCKHPLFLYLYLHMSLHRFLVLLKYSESTRKRASLTPR